MIKASELRVCNLVLIDGEVSPVLEIHGKGIVHRYDIETETPQLASFGEIQPIPLTQHWMDRISCQVNVVEVRQNRYVPVEYVIGPITVMYPVPYSPDASVFGKSVSIKFLHQLQNLYFALTGGELTVKAYGCQSCNAPVSEDGLLCDRCAKAESPNPDGPPYTYSDPDNE